MDPVEFLVDSLRRNHEMLTMTLGDFSDADMLQRPCPGANHAAWQLGHLVNAETGMGNFVKPGAVPPVPEALAAKFKKETASNDDPAFFPKKAALIEAFDVTRRSTIEAVRSLSPADLDRPTEGRLTFAGPTVQYVISAMMGHAMMHVGQFQVIRRKLGKPVIF